MNNAKWDITTKNGRVQMAKNNKRDSAAAVRAGSGKGSGVGGEVGVNWKLIWGSVGALVALLLLSVVMINPSNPVEGGESGEVLVSGAELPPYSADTGSVDAAKGQTAPEILGNDFDEGEIVIGGATGEVQMLMFVAHWCPFCQAEVPKLVEYINQNGEPDGVTTTVIATGTNSVRDNYPPSAWLERESWGGPILVDDREKTAGNAYGLTAYPFWVVVDREGKVVGRTAGVVSIEDLYQTAAGIADGSYESGLGSAGERSPGG